MRHKGAVGSRAVMALAGILSLPCGLGAGDGGGPLLGPVAVAREDDGGARGLEERGIVLGIVAREEVMSKLAGGLCRNRPTPYRGRFDLVAEIDTERLGLWPGGRIFLDLQNGHGSGLSERHVGDLQVVSNIDAHAFTQLAEWWVEQALLRGRLRVRFGRQDANAELAALDLAAAFLNSSFGLIPAVPAPTFPAPAIGVTVLADLGRGLSLGAGVYDRTPFADGTPDGSSSGVELRFAPGGTGAALANRYRLGAWRQGALEQEPGGPSRGGWAAYASAEQVVFREADARRGAGLFVQLGGSPAAATGVSGYLGLGAVYTGLLRGRADDVLGVGVAHARAAPARRTVRSETAIELFYRISLRPGLDLQPDLQYVLSPGGSGRNAFVAGLRFEARF